MDEMRTDLKLDPAKEKKEDADTEPTIWIMDPKILVAVISGVVSIIVALIPALDASGRTLFLGVLLALIALIFGGTALRALSRESRARAIAAVVAAAAVGAAAVVGVGRWAAARPGLRYTGSSVSVYAGTGERTFRDGSVEECAFVSPRSLSAGEDAVYLTDADRVRCLEDGEASTEPFPSDRYNALLARSLGQDLYVLAETRRTGEDGAYQAVFLRVRNGQVEEISEPLDMGAFRATVADMAFSRSGVLWLIRLYDAPGSATVTLEKLPYDRDTDRYGPPEWAMDLPYGTMDMRDARMVFDEKDDLYISAPGQGVILRWRQGEQGAQPFAGEEGVQVSSDRGSPTFSYPTSLAADGGWLYVLDNGLVRRVPTGGERASRSETLAGLMPDAVTRALEVGRARREDEISGDAFAFPADASASLAVDGRGRLLLSDPVNGLIYEIRSGADG